VEAFAMKKNPREERKNPQNGGKQEMFYHMPWRKPWQFGPYLGA
jgi:hypothetical protein